MRLRASRSTEPALDPVEEERKRLRGLETGGEAEDTAPEERVARWTLARKLAVTLAVGLLAGYILIWARSVQDSRGPEGYVRRTDFISSLTGALIIREGNGPSLYDLDMQRVVEEQALAPYATLNPGELLPYNHLPFEALLIAPLINLPFPVIFAIWTMLAGLAIGLTLGVMDEAMPVAHPTGWVMSLAACSYLPLIRALMLGQNSPLVLLGLCATYASVKHGRSSWAGLALLLVALKPQALPVILLVLLLQRQWKALLVFAGLMSALVVLVMPLLGAQWPLQYAQLLLGVAGWNDPNAINPAIMYNWRGFFTNLVGGDAPGLVTPLFVLLSLVSALLLVWAWRRSRSARGERTAHFYAYGRPSSDLIWALAGVVAVVTSTHLNPHDLSLLIFPAWIIGAYATSGLWNAPTSRFRLALLWTGYALAPLTLYLPNPALSVVPTVLLMAVAMLMLARDIGTAPQQLLPN